jgi:acyl-CoA thioesterase I
MRCAGISQHIFLIVALLWLPQASIGATKSEPKAILFLGDSLTAGYGLDRSKAYPALIQGEIDSRGWKFRVINAGQSGDTSAGGLDRLGWLLKQRINVLVLELGANDGLRGLPVEVTRRNLQAIIDRTKAKYPGVRVVIAEMQVPPNMGREYGDRFKAIFSDLAERNRAVLIPFLLDGVGGVPELNLPDGIHPTARGHERVAQNVWSVLEPLLRALRNGSES